MTTIDEVPVTFPDSSQAVGLEPTKAPIEIPIEDTTTRKAVVVAVALAVEETEDATSEVSNIKDIPIENLSLEETKTEAETEREIAREEVLPIEEKKETEEVEDRVVADVSKEAKPVLVEAEASAASDPEAVPPVSELKAIPPVSEPDAVPLQAESPSTAEPEAIRSPEAPPDSEAEAVILEGGPLASEPETGPSQTEAPPA